MRASLLVQVFHGGGAQDDEEAHPQCGTLERNGFIRLAFLGMVVGFEDDGVEKQGEEPKDEQQLDTKDDQILGMVLHAGAGL